ncbi:MAG TPA: ATP-binding protein [Methylomirabilota bacterium]|nr:ATP-binding protein [Methylomirabilota bacterium]
MPSAPAPGSPAEPLLREREQTIQKLRKASIALLGILLVVVALACLALAMAAFGEEQFVRAVEATQLSQQKLAESYLSQARAERVSRSLGSKERALAALRSAAAITNSPQLRQEASDVLALTDLNSPELAWPGKVGTDVADVDRDFTRYLRFGPGNEATLHALQSNEGLHLFGGASRPVRGRFSRDGKLVAIRYADGWVQVWNCTDGTTRFKALVDQGSTIAFDREGKILAVGDARAQKVRLFDTSTGNEGGAIDSAPAEHLVFNPADSRQLGVLTSDGVFAIRNVEDGATVFFARHNSRIVSIAWSDNGRVAAGGCEDGQIVRWDLSSGQALAFRAGDASHPTPTINPTGTLIASQGWDGVTRVHLAASGELLRSTQSGLALGFNRDGTKLAFRKEPGGLGVWGVAQSRALETWNVSGGGRKIIFSISSSADGKWLAVMREDGVRLLRQSDGAVMGHEPLERIWDQSVQFDSRSGRLFGASPSGMHAWAIDEEDGKAVFRQELFVSSPRGLETDWVRISPDGINAAVRLSSAHVICFPLADPKAFVAFPNMPVIRGLALNNARGEVVISSDKFGTRVFSVATGKPVRELSAADGQLQTSADGRWACLAANDRAILYSLPEWREEKSFQVESGGTRSGLVAFSHDSKLLAATLSDSEIVLHDLSAGRERLRLNSMDLGNMNALEFDAKGEALFIATKGADVIHKWNFAGVEAELVSLGLDGRRHAEVPAAAPSARVQRFQKIAGLILTTLILTLAAVLFVLHRHRAMLSELMAKETLIVRKSRDLELAQAELLHSEKMTALGTMAAGIAHDFNNLLSVIRMSNDLIGESRDRKEIRENVAEIEQAVTQGRQVVRSLLGYTRENAGEAQHYSAEEMTRNLLRLLRKQFLANIQVKVVAEPNLPPVFGHAARIEQALLNIIVNAAEAMPNGGAISVRLSMVKSVPAAVRLRPTGAEEYLRISLKDTGPGIAPDQIGRIFEPFYTTKNGGPKRGTGLGLSLVYAVCEKEGAGLQVASAPDEGAEFSIYLPIAASQNPCAESTVAANAT